MSATPISYHSLTAVGYRSKLLEHRRLSLSSGSRGSIGLLLRWRTVCGGRWRGVAALNPEVAFHVSSVGVMPLKGVLQTRWAMESIWLPVAIGLLYSWMLMSCLSDGMIQQMITVISRSFPKPDIAGFSELLMESKMTALTWINLIVMDFYQARAVFLDGVKKGMVTGHSVVLCFMFGPLGLLSHSVTGMIYRNKTESTGLLWYRLRLSHGVLFLSVCQTLIICPLKA